MKKFFRNLKCYITFFQLNSTQWEKISYHVFNCNHFENGSERYSFIEMTLNITTAITYLLRGTQSTN